MHSRFAATILLVVCGLLNGCSNSETPLKTFPVTGEVKRMNGEPVGNVSIIFHPKTGPTAVARADDGGKFTANVPLGDCRVAVVSATEATSDTSPEAAEAAAGKSKIDMRFASPDSSGLTVKVEEKQTEKVVLVVE
jgi:hypothetical protein